MDFNVRAIFGAVKYANAIRSAAALFAEKEARKMTLPTGGSRVGHNQHGEFHEAHGRHGGPSLRSQPGGNSMRVSTIDGALDHHGCVYIEHADLDDGETGYIVTLGVGVCGCACKTLGAAIRSAAVAAGGGS